MSMTKEQLLKTKPPADVIAELKSFSDTTGKPMNDIKDTFYSILTEPYLSSIEDIADRCRQASKILLAQLAEKMSYQTATVEFKVIDKTAIRKFERKVKTVDPITGQETETKEDSYASKIYGIFAGTGEFEAEYPTKFGILSLWGDASQLTPSLTIDNAYSGQLGITNHESYYALTLNDKTELPQVQLEGIPPIKDIITNFFPSIPVSLAAQNLSDPNTRNDYRLIMGRIKSKRVALSKKGKDIGWLELIDNNATLEESKQNQFKLSIMFQESPEMVLRYDTGSLVYVLCTLTFSEQYGISSFGQLIVPIVGIPVRKPAQPNKDVAGSSNQNVSNNSAGQTDSGGHQKKASVPSKSPVQHPPVSELGNEGSSPGKIPKESEPTSEWSSEYSGQTEEHQYNSETGSWTDEEITDFTQGENTSTEEPGPEDVVGW